RLRQGGDDAEAAGIRYRRGELGIADVVHATLDDGVLDAEQFGDPCLHDVSLSIAGAIRLGGPWAAGRNPGAAADDGHDHSVASESRADGGQARGWRGSPGADPESSPNRHGTVTGRP